MEVAIYARVSSLQQQKDATIESQLSRLRNYAQAQGWQTSLEHTYSDDGVSGTILARPALDRLRDAARTGAIELVLMLSPDRLARKYAHQCLLIDEFEKVKISVVFLENPFGDSPQGRLLIQMQGIMAEYERAAILERTRRGKLEKARRGELMPWAYNCYGYQYLPKRAGLPAEVIIDEVAASVIKDIYHYLVVEQLSMRQIVKRLNERGILTPAGQQLWSVSSVHRILTNSSYMGKARYNYHASAQIAVEKRRPQSEWVWSQSPAIITEELFEKARLQLEKNQQESAKTYRATTQRYLLRRRVKCGVCGLSMSCQTHKSGNKTYLYYQCNGKDILAHARANKCSSANIAATQLDELVWQALVELLQQPALITALHEEFTHSQMSDLDQFAQQRLILLKRKQRFETQIEKLIDAYQQEAISLIDLKERRKKLLTGIAQLERELSLLSQQQHKLIHWQEFLVNVEAFTTLLGKNLDRLAFTERQLVTQALIDKVIVTGQDVDIFYVLPFQAPPIDLTDKSLAADSLISNPEHFCRLRLEDCELRG